jgi:hypothetical protein
LDNQHEQVRPPGFHVIVMPYADDIRPVPPVQGHEANDEQIDAAKAFVERLSIKGRFDPLVYENPGNFVNVKLSRMASVIFKTKNIFSVAETLCRVASSRSRTPNGRRG